MGKKALHDSFAVQMSADGEQHWHVREYVRQVLAGGQIDAQAALQKLCTTRLVQSFPDTIEEINANAFYFAQSIGAPYLE